MSTNLGDLLKAAGLAPSPHAAAPDPGTPDTEVPVEKGSMFGPKVVLRVTKKGRGGKTVTEVQGIRRPEQLAKSLRKQLGVGTTVEGELIVVQGDQRARLRPILTKLGAKHIVDA